MKIRIDSVGYDKKPTEYIFINKRLAECEAADIEWQSFCDLAGNKGHAFCVADFKGNKRNTESFKSQQLSERYRGDLYHR